MRHGAQGVRGEEGLSVLFGMPSPHLPFESAVELFFRQEDIAAVVYAF